MIPNGIDSQFDSTKWISSGLSGVGQWGGQVSGLTGQTTTGGTLVTYSNPQNQSMSYSAADVIGKARGI
jgi:hypothetical protein